MTDTTTTEVVEQLPIEAVIPDPGNRRVTLDKEFVASIRTHGVIQPLLVTPHGDRDGCYELVAGHRRLGAARRVGLPTVPALIRVLTEEEKLTLALVDNIQRNALRPMEEAVAMSRIVELGASVSKVARAIGRSAGYVRDRLKLMELPADARHLVDDNTISIEDGLVLVGLVDHPEVLAAVVADIGSGRGGDVGWMVSTALRQADAEAKVAAARTKAEKKGLAIVEHQGHQPTDYVELATYRGLDIDPKAHANEPCHAVVIGPRDGALVPVCVDRKRHAPKGASPVKAPAKVGPDAQARAEKAARREATERRREFLGALMAGRITKADVLGLVLPNYLEDANTNEQAAIAKLLGVEPSEADRYDRWSTVLREYAAISETSRLRACLAFSLVQGEDALNGGWGPERTERHRAFLIAKGYEPTAFEVDQAEAAARRHQESLARTAELRAQPASSEDASAGIEEAAVEAAVEDRAEPRIGEEEDTFDDAG